MERLLSDWLDDGEECPVVDGDLSASEASEEIAETLLVHGILVDVGNRDDVQDARRVSDVMQRIDSESESTIRSTSAPNKPRSRRFAILASAFTTAAMVMVVFVLLSPHQGVSAAMASLEKVVDVAARHLDRTYSVSVIEEYPQHKRPRNLSQEAWERETKKQLDGAILYVRGATQHVMKVRLKSGENRFSGSDGNQSWAFRENGPVHTSTELDRFRGGVPGQQQNIPFLNIHGHLLQLQTGYHVELGEKPYKFREQKPLSQLIGIRKSRDVRGPKQVRIWFDPHSGTVHEMLLDGLPRGGGGPKSVLLKLIDQSELPADFFSHESHHKSERRVIHD